MLSTATNVLLRSGARRLGATPSSAVYFRPALNLCFTSGSHDDFAPKRKTISDEDEALSIIKVRFCTFNVLLLLLRTRLEPICLASGASHIFTFVSQEQVENNRIMLYMKGNPSMPMCGFSARVIQILQKEDVPFSSVNVLDYPSIREGVKKFS